MTQAVLFDLDGTLIDSVEDIADATNRTLAAHGLPTHPVYAYRNYIGDGVRNLMLRALPEKQRDEQTIAACLKTYRIEYGRCWNVKTCLYPGIAEMLSSLRERRMKLTLLSNKPDEFVQMCGEHYLGAWRFDVMMGASSRFPHKPNPASALEVARICGVAPAHFLYVGDMPVDMETARRSGMRSVGVTWGLRDGESLSAAGADQIVSAPGEILAHL